MTCPSCRGTGLGRVGVSRERGQGQDRNLVPATPPLSTTMPTLPPVHPDTTASGIATDPSSQERVVPSSVRADGRYVCVLRLR